MTAERLREAAEQARAEAESARSVAPHLAELYADDCGSERDARRHLAVADWLNMTADHLDPEVALDGGCPDCEQNGALAVANAYLGDRP